MEASPSDEERLRLVDTTPNAPRETVEPPTYPAWCTHALFLVTLLSLLSHYIPSDWLRDPPPSRITAVEHELPAAGFAFATPSKLPHADVLEEVRYWFLLGPGPHTVASRSQHPPAPPPLFRCLTRCTVIWAACARPRSGASPRACRCPS